MPANALRYSKSRFPSRHMMMRRPMFYPPVPVRQESCWDIFLSILAALFCINLFRGGRRGISGGAGIGGIGGITTGGGGVTSGGGGVTSGGGSSSCG
ncbi:unnamed protein product, partial [Rotaria sp. Silwood1]